MSFPDIVQECSLEQCLTASRAKTSKKNDIFYSNVIERPLKLACFICATSLNLLVRKHKRMLKIRSIEHCPGSRMSLRQGSPLIWEKVSNTRCILFVSRSDLITGQCGR